MWLTVCSLVSVEIYPREGTETFFFFASSRLRWLKFIPVRGRVLSKPNISFIGLNLSP